MLEASPFPIDHFPAVLARIPSHIDVEALAREVKAFQRPRGVRSATDLLRLALAWGPGGYSMQCVAAWAGERKIATLTEDVPFVMEMVIENGRGYVPATEHSPNVQEIGIIPVDAVYSPVVRVRYEIEETRVGQKTNYDRLTVEIWTNGSIHPELALVESAKILRKHLNPFVQYAELGARVHSSGRGVGGSSAVNAQVAIRGLPGDYDRWAASGCVGWDWDGVREAFERVA